VDIVLVQFLILGLQLGLNIRIDLRYNPVEEAPIDCLGRGVPRGDSLAKVEGCLDDLAPELYNFGLNCLLEVLDILQLEQLADTAERRLGVLSHEGILRLGVNRVLHVTHK